MMQWTWGCIYPGMDCCMLYNLLWIISREQSSRSQILSSAWLRLLLQLSFYWIFHFIHYILQLQNICLVLFYDFYLFAELLVLLMHYFPEFTEFSVFSWISLNFLKMIILDSFSGNLQVSISFRSVMGKLLCSFVVSSFLASSFVWWFCINVWTFQGAVTSSSLFRLALVGKHFYLKVTARQKLGGV